jgi:hypothetical protein
VDVFGGLTGGPDDDPMGVPSGPPVDPGDLEAVLDGAALWGAELDTRYRVLALTLEPTADRYAWGETSDRRIQVLLFPVSTILASLRAVVDGKATLQTFDADQLVDVAGAFGGVEVASPIFGGGEPRPGEWGPQFSMQGRSSAPDGTNATASISVHTDDAMLDVFARFDEVNVKGPQGANLQLPPAD